MNHWETWMQMGDEAFLAQDYLPALEAYEQSLKAVFNRFGRYIEQDPQDAMTAVLVSYKQIARAQISLDRLDEANTQYESAYCFICRMINGHGLMPRVWNASIEVLGDLCQSWRLHIEQHAEVIMGGHQNQFQMAQETYGKLVKVHLEGIKH